MSVSTFIVDNVPKDHEEEYHLFIDNYTYLMEPGTNWCGGYYNPHTKKFKITLFKDSLIVKILDQSGYNEWDLENDNNHLYAELNFVQMEWLLDNLKEWYSNYLKHQSVNKFGPKELPKEVVSLISTYVWTPSIYDHEKACKRLYRLTDD
jgi:hypothetical protein